MPGECSELKEYVKNLGINFRDSKNLVDAFTHSSYSQDNYERLEFLGDSVLRIVISKYLFNKFKEEGEGKLTALRAEIVSDKTLTKFARKLEFEKYVRIGKGEKRKGRAMETFLACVFEAFLGAIYIEYGSNSLDIIDNFIIKNFQNEIIEIEKNIDYMNPKAMLQEYSQKKFHILPKYNLAKEEGLAHDKQFSINVVLNDRVFKEAKGHSKKEAEKKAAINALIELKLMNKEEFC